MPARIRRSRAIWDEARRPDAPWTSTARAILYEIQPIRLSTFDVTRVTSSVRTAVWGVAHFMGQTLPYAAWTTIRFVGSWSRRDWTILGGVIAYLYAVRYIHNLLDAGPMVIIVSALVAIFTVGLGDGENADGVSAYSVFNRGFERLMGSVDVESLVAQYAGGALAVQAQGVGGHHEDEVIGGGRDGNVRPAGAVGRGQGRGPADPVGNDAREAAAGPDGDGIADENDAPRQEGRNNRQRRSGKKGRRRNLEIRREMQRQRQAAAAMGFAGDGGQQDIDAMNRLIEAHAAGTEIGVQVDDIDEEEWEDDLGMDDFDEQ